MGRLFLLIYKYRAMLIFVILEVICAWMIVSTDLFVSAAAFNSSNRLVANTIKLSNSANNYLGLQEVNRQLAEDNKKLRQEIKALKQSMYNINVIRIDDPEIIAQYEYFDAKVVNNTTEWLNNFVTINKGTSDGVEPGMGVINQFGIVGKVQSASKHYAVVASMLHNDVLVSSKITRTGTIGTINWTGGDPTIADLKYIPRHIQPVVGDTIVTSGYNAVFPENIPIGIIESSHLDDDKNFHDIKVKLSNDFTSLSYVYVIKNKLKAEKDSIETENTIIPIQ